MQNIKIYQTVQGIGPVSLFSEFELRQNLDLSQISFDNLIGYILSISMCMQNFIIIFFTVLGIGPFSLFFRIWSSANPRPIKNVSSQSLGLDLVNINVYAKVYQNIPLSSRVNFHFFQNLNLGKTSTNHKCHLTISWATSCQYTDVYAKFHHNIPLSSSLGPFSLFSEFGARQNLDR